jgi:hypothetical protein
MEESTCKHDDGVRDLAGASTAAADAERGDVAGGGASTPESSSSGSSPLLDAGAQGARGVVHDVDGEGRDDEGGLDAADASTQGVLTLTRDP